MSGPSLEPIHTDALRQMMKNTVLLEALRRVVEAEVNVVTSDLRAAVTSGSLHSASVLEGHIQGIESFLQSLGRYG